MNNGCLLGAVLLVGGVLGAQQTPAEPPVGEIVPQASQIGLTREDAQRRISELEAATEIDEERRARLVELYRQLVQRFDAERSSLERADAFRQSITAAPTETERVRSELAAQKAAAQGPAPTRPADATADELQQQLAALQGELANLRAQQAELGRRVTEEEGRPPQVQKALADARSVLAELETQLAAPEPGPDAPEAERIAHGLLLARQRARAAEIQMLEQELLSNAARVELLKARREAASWRVAQADQRAERLEGWSSELRQAEAERARQEAEQLAREARLKHPLILQVAQNIERITEDTEKIVPRIDAVRQRRNQIEAQLAQTQADYEQTKRSLELGITRALGTVLLEQRRNLPDARTFRRAASDRSTRVTQAQLRLFEIEREIDDLQDPEKELDRLLPRIDDLSEDEREALRGELSGLLETKLANLQLLKKALQDYLRAIGNLVAREQQLIERAEELGAILDERLLWIPNAYPVGMDFLRQLPADALKLLKPELWRQTLSVAYADLERLLGGYIGAGLLLTGFAALRRRARKQLETISRRVGKVREDGILLTLQAFVLHVLNTLPLSAAAAFLGWRLMAAPGSTDLAKAVGAGLVTAAAVGFSFQLLRNLFRKGGLVRGHFRWTERTGRHVRRHLLWYMGIALPTSFLVALTQSHPDPLLRIGLGRLAFMVLMVAAAALGWLLLHPTRGLVVGRQIENASTWLRRSRPLWMPLGVLVPLTLAIMAATGYYYAALQLEYRLNQTVLIILFAVFLHAFCLRWLMISQRRLALKVALERRAALAKKTEAGELEESAEGAMEALEGIDVSEIGDQTKDLLRISVGLYFVVAIWFAWVGVLPALGVLDNVPLWDHEVIVDGEGRMVPITLANVGLALLAIVVTVTAARNMPGFLEIAVLQRLPLEPGVRYATRTLVLYTIVTTGILVAFNAIGVGWSSVQWLVAALTVGLGFGLQEIFANFVSGLIILLERPVRVGDTVTVAEISGVVTRIRMRATTITDWNRRELVVPNKNFITGELINWSLSDPILRLDFVVGIAYGSDTTLAHRTMLQTCRDHPLVLDQPEPNVFFRQFGDNSLNFDVRVFVSEPTNTGRSRILHDLHMAIDKACRERDITIAFPQRDLHFKTQETVLRVALEEGPAKAPGGAS